MNSDNWKECERNVQLYKELNAKHIDTECGRNKRYVFSYSFRPGIQQIVVYLSVSIILSLSCCPFPIKFVSDAVCLADQGLKWPVFLAVYSSSEFVYCFSKFVCPVSKYMRP